MPNVVNSVCVIGLGYVGLPTAATLAACGINVIAVDVDEERVSAINRGSVVTVEPGLQALVHTAIKAGNLRAQTQPAPADAFIIAVPTPHDDQHSPDVSYVRRAGQSIAPVLKRGDLVILESTSPVGTTERLCAWLASERSQLSFPHTAGEESDVRVAYSAERAMPGRLLRELLNNDRVIGGVTRVCTVAAAAFYRKFVRGCCHLTTSRTAELTKLAENAYRDVNIAFANEISIVCSDFDIDPWELIELANRHPRVHILQPGPGVGGHCVAVDPWFIVHSSRDKTPLIQMARHVNSERPFTVAGQVIEACKELRHPTVACLGLSYKADVGDMRESPAITVVRHLQDAALGTLLVVEPHLKTLPAALLRANTNLVSLAEAVDVADVILLLTDHSVFRTITGKLLSDKLVIDTRGFFRAQV